MKTNRSLPPVWLMGLSGASYGLVGGFMAFALAQVLAARHFSLLRITAIAAYMAIQLSYSAPGGWLSSVSPKDQENRLSAWLTVSNTAGFGVMAFLAGELIRRLPPRPASLAC